MLFSSFPGAISLLASMHCVDSNCIDNEIHNVIAYESIRDGEEYNLIGFTEHVEGRLEEIRRNGFAYRTYISERFPSLCNHFVGCKACFETRTLSLLVDPVLQSGFLQEPY